MEASFHARELKKIYGGRTVVKDVSLNVAQGEVVGLLGPNGAGKSTLIKAAMGLLPLGSGYVRMFDKDLNDVRHKVSYVPQRETVDWDFPTSVLDVVIMGRYAKLGLLTRPRKADKEMAMNCLKKVGMEAYTNRQISQLSGGQQQRVFLARALAQEADLYFMDEPFAGVDAATESAILAIMQEMTASGKTVIVVHHDLQSAAEFFDWIVLLNMRLVASGPIDKVFNNELLQETYGGKLTVLAEVGELVRKRQMPSREKY